MSQATQSLSNAGKNLRWAGLTGCLLPLFGASLLNHGYPLPIWGCPIRHLTGIPCPTCGMTRSFKAIAQGNWQTAFEMHLFGPVLFGLLVLLCGCLLIELGVDRTVFRALWMQVRRPRIWGSAIALVLLYHAGRLYHLQQTGDLQTAFSHSPLGHLLF